MEVTRAKLVDFLVGKIREEKADAGTYMEWGSADVPSEVKTVLTKIANEELSHQDHLVSLLASMAKEGGEGV